MTPTLGIIIPTPGRATLGAVLDSVAGQDLQPGDHVVVVGDTTDGPLPAVQALVESYGFTYLAHGAGHDYGHSQINAGMDALAGGPDYLLFQDDDDGYLPGALQTAREALARSAEPLPALFRFRSYTSGVVWHRVGLVAQGHIGGHCVAAPNDPARLGRWGPSYEGDYTFIAETLAHYGGRATWHTPVLTYARPPIQWRRVRGDHADLEALRALRNAGREWLRDPRAVGAEEQVYWWNAHDPARLRAYLFSVGGVTVGAGLLSQRDGRWWVTLLVAPEHRGRGVGRAIYGWLAWAAPWPVWAEVRADNEPSLRAARRAGYRDAEARPGYLTLRYDAREMGV